MAETRATRQELHDLCASLLEELAAAQGMAAGAEEIIKTAKRFAENSLPRTTQLLEILDRGRPNSAPYRAKLVGLDMCELKVGRGGALILSCLVCGATEDIGIGYDVPTHLNAAMFQWQCHIAYMAAQSQLPVDQRVIAWR